jgi:hypothetical protein
VEKMVCCAVFHIVLHFSGMWNEDVLYCPIFVCIMF